MKILLILLALSLCLSSAAFASSMNCSSADARTQVQSGQYEGGPAPPPEMRLSYFDVIQDGERHEDVSYRFSAKRVLSSGSDAEYRSEVFVARIQADLGEGRVVKALVLCDSKTYIGAPRP